MTRTIQWRSLHPDECTAKVGRARLYVRRCAWEAYLDGRLIAEGAEGQPD